MRPRKATVLVMLLVFTIVGYSIKQRIDNTGWIFTHSLATPDRVVLYAIDGLIPSNPFTGPASNAFHDGKIAGAIDLQGSEATAAIRQFESVIRKERNNLCLFDPHHGLRIVTQGHNFDLLLCYHCGDMILFSDGNYVRHYTTSGTPDVLDAILQTHKQKQPAIR